MPLRLRHPSASVASDYKSTFDTRENPRLWVWHRFCLVLAITEIGDSQMRKFTLAVVLLLTPTVANASLALVNPPNGDQQVTLNGATTKVLDLSSPLSVTQSSPYGYAAASAQGTPVVNAAVSTQTNIDSNIATRAGLDYYLRLNGPSFNGTIPILYRSNLGISASGPAGYGGNEASSATATFVLQSYSAYPDGTPYQNLTNQSWNLVGSTRFGSGPIVKNQEVSGILDLGVGNLLLAGIIADVSAQDGGQASAFADPYFVIDPTFTADHTGYSLSFSPFAGNSPVASVPEPATWALMLLGFGLIGFAMRKRSNVRTTVSNA